MTDKLSRKISTCKELLEKEASGDRISKENLEEEINSLREWIGFFQHERLIHLLVLILFAVLTFASFAICVLTLFWPMGIPFVMFTILLVPYIFHYYKLENGVQMLYELYDRLKGCRDREGDLHE